MSKRNLEDMFANLEDMFAEIDSQEEIENIGELVNELWDVYHRFSELSHRVMRVFKRYMPGKNERIGLSHYILSLFDKHEKLTRENIMEYLMTGDFEYTVSQKSLTDSLYFLTKTNRLDRYMDSETGQDWYIKGKG